MPDRDAHVILYCASGNRSAYGARTLEQDLGYTNVSLDDRRDHAVEGPRLRGSGPAHAHPRAARSLLAPHADPRDRRRGPAEAARREGAAARRGRARLADGPVSGGGRRRHARDRRRRRRRPLQPAAPGDPHDRPRGRAEGRLRRGDDQGAEPRRERRQVPDADRRVEHRGDHRGLRRDRRRGRQLPHPLPAQRRDRAPEDPRGVRLDPRLRRSAVGVQTVRRPLLPLPVPRAAARPSSRPPAAPTACSACSPARWACCRRPR